MKKSLLAAVLTVTLIATGCSAAWLTTFDSWLAIAAPVVIQILDIVALAKGVAVNPATVAKVNGDSAALKVLVQSVENASQQNLPTACSAFNAGVSTFVADVPTLEQIGQVSDPTKQTQIADLVSLVQGVVSEIEIPIASCQNSASVKNAFESKVQLKSPSAFVKSFNSVVDRAADTKKFKVHIHSKPVRVLSFGLLK